MGDARPEPSFGRDNAVIIAVASIGGGIKLANILARLIIDLGVQALESDGIEHVCVLAGFGDAAIAATELTARKLPMIERPEIRDGYVFDIDTDSIDPDDPPRMLIVAGRNSFPNRDAAIELAWKLFEVIGDDEVDIENVPLLFVEAEPSRRGYLDERAVHEDTGQPFRRVMFPARKGMKRAGARLLGLNVDDPGTAA